MREIPKWIKKMIGRLMPTQTSSGNGAIQIGKLQGSVTNVHLTQHIYAPAPMQAAAPQPRPRTTSSTDQSQVLALIDRVPDRIAVLDFMEREFDTRMVIHLGPKQLYRLRRYVEAILNNLGEK